MNHVAHTHPHSNFMDGATTLSSVLDKLEAKIDKEGLDALMPGRCLSHVTHRAQICNVTQSVVSRMRPRCLDVWQLLQSGHTWMSHVPLE